MNKEKHAAFKNFISALGLPKQALLHQDHLEITGRNELIIDNAKGILDYEAEYIRLLLPDGHMIVQGKSLRVDMFVEKTIIIRGEIVSLTFE